MEKILFSAIGTTDPVRNYHDGSWIHCCRHIVPDLTVIFLTSEMLTHEKDSRLYSKTLEMLNEHLHKHGKPQIELEIVERPALVNPHLNGSLLSDFGDIIRDLHDRYPEAEIYLNCSSGTPAIKEAIANIKFLLPFGELIHFMQVDAPDSGRDYNGQRTDKSYDTAASWEYNEDNDEDAPIRMHPLDNIQRDALMSISYAKKLISQYNYHAALDVLADAMPVLPEAEKIAKVLTGADHRQMLMLTYATTELKDLQLSDAVKPLSGSLAHNCAEMLLTMRNDIQKHDYAGMLRKLTPLLYGLCRLTLLQFLSIDIDKYIVTKEKKAGFDEEKHTVIKEKYIKFETEKFEKDHPSVFQVFINNPQYHPPALPATSNLLPVLEKLLSEKQAVKEIHDLRDIEKDARNLAAHDLQGIDDEWIKKKAGYSSEEIIKKLKTVVKELVPEIKKDYWQSYEEMNEKICDLLNIR